MYYIKLDGDIFAEALATVQMKGYEGSYPYSCRGETAPAGSLCSGLGSSPVPVAYG